LPFSLAPQTRTARVGLGGQRKSHIAKLRNVALTVLPGAELEPARLAAGDFESPESIDFTTRADTL